MTELYPDLIANGTITIEELKTFRSGDYPLRRVGDLNEETLSWPAIGATDGSYYEDTSDFEFSIRLSGIVEPLEAVHEPDGSARLLDGHHRAVTLIAMGWDKPIPIFWYCEGKECHV